MSFSGTKGYITKPKPGVMLNPLHPLSRGLVAYWLFNEGSGSLANDISGNKNRGRLKNVSPNTQGSGWNSSKFGGGLQFDGVDDCVEVPDDGSLDITDAITIEGWIYPLGWGGGNYGRIVDKGGNGYAFILHNSSGQQSIRFQSVAAGVDQSADNNSIILNELQHVVVTYDRKNVNFYVNGLYKGGGVETAAMSTCADIFFIGNRSDLTRTFDGTISYIRIYNRALSVAEVKQLYHNPFCNMLYVPIRRYSVAAPPVGAIMNQFQRANIGADLYNGAILA